MKSSLQIPPAVIKAQTDSSDPKASVWVSANAGSGKTHVLTERVIRLLLRGTKPARILCLTYTKAAAANMQSRIFDRLAQWTVLDDADLSAALEKLEGIKPDNDRLYQARRLFAYALETPGGLKIQTIHAFCEALLHRFPLEANIPGHFEMMDDIVQADCIAKVKKQLFAEIHRNKTSAAAAAFALILQKAGEDALHKLLAEAVTHKQKLNRYCAFISKNGEELFTEILGLQRQAQQAIETHINVKTVLAENLKQQALWETADLTRIGNSGGSRAADFIAKINSAATENNPEKLLNIMLSAYFKTDNSPQNPSYLFSKKALATWPELAELFLCKAEATAVLADKWKSVDLAELNSAAYVLINDLLQRYRAVKLAQGLLDFGDLIDRTLALLKRRGAGQWVQYKLDQGIDHILVDEAQDTGPEQWEIIRLLSQDFFSGFGAREDLQRTLFAVGDEKQSIYSFQGAAPQDFAENGLYIKCKASNANMLFRHKKLAFSFRSADDVLAAVDKVFAAPQNYQGLSAENMPTVHSAVRVHDQGYVDIWPAFCGQNQEEPEDWIENLDLSADPAVLLAENITEIIAHWLCSKEILPGKNRPVQTGDIMILVRKRGAFVHALTRALKNRSIPVAGADRLHLTDHIAVRDLMALGDFVLQPRDDLALACVLKSPLFNISEEVLLHLAAEREGTLFAALEKAVRHKTLPEEHKILAEASEKLHIYRSFVDIKPVYEFYSKILAEDGGRRKFLARLGNEAGDILDAFLDYCLNAQKNGLPGLQAFLQDLSRNNPEIKRELDQNRDEIRIMTVHAAKGLEAPIVFLVDGGSSIWHSSNAPCLLPLPVPEKRVLQSGLPDNICLWLPKAEYKTQLAAQILDRLKQAAEEEYRRLLYVGMTRAEDRLILCGYYGVKQPQNTWLSLVRQALCNEAETVTYAAGSIKALRYWHKKSAAELQIKTTNRQDEIVSAAALPDFLAQKAAAEPVLPRPLTPSGAASIIEAMPETDPDIMRRSPILPDFITDKEVSSKKIENRLDFTESLFSALEKGRLIHALLQYLPDIELKFRKKLAQTYIETRLGTDKEILKQDILDNVFHILEDARFTSLFSTASRAEVGLMGLVKVKGQKRAVSGQIDRLAVFENHVLFADYKTGYIPAEAAEIPFDYKMQMALYTALLTALYPRKTIKALLIYTREGRVFPFGSAELLPILA